MKWMIASDLHGSAHWCRKLVEAFHREQADRLILLGDTLYHGPRNPLPEEYDPKSCVAQLTELSGRIVSVRGNCDADVDQMVLPFPIMAEYALLDLGSRLAFLTHGDRWNPDNLPAMAQGGLLINGHTHVAACEEHQGYWYMNPSSPSLPKDGGFRGYLLLSSQGARLCHMDGTVEKELNF